MDDVLGWQKTRWGMKVEDIISCIGKDNVTRTPLEEYGPFYSSLRIDGLYVGNHRFNVIFQMDYSSNGLSQVLIKYDDLDPEPMSAPTNVFNTAMKILKEKYGNPERIGTSENFSWSFETTTIELATLFIEGITASVFIRFMPTGKSLAAKKANFSAF